MRLAATLTLAAALPAVVGGVIFWEVHGGTLLTRAIAYGFWFAAAAVLVAMMISGQRFVWRRLPVTPPEGWVFLTAAIALTAIGVAIDLAGS
jgi:hypothetical protein